MLTSDVIANKNKSISLQNILVIGVIIFLDTLFFYKCIDSTSCILLVSDTLSSIFSVSWQMHSISHIPFLPNVVEGLNIKELNVKE